MTHSSEWYQLNNDNLPQKGKAVLVYTPDAPTILQIATWSVNGNVFLVTSAEGRTGYIQGTVTHWMALPELPNL